MARRVVGGGWWGLALALSLAQPAFAQLATTPNAKGVTFGHLHFSTFDVAAQHNFWVALGGTPTPNLDLDLIQFPGIYVVTWQRDQIAPMEDSTTPVVTFKVRNLNESIASWVGRSLVVERGATPGQAFVYAPDRTRIEILEDTSIAPPIQFYRVHLVTPSPDEARAFYARRFGGVPTTSGGLDALQFPGGVMTFGLARNPAPTRGHRLDHWGFEIRNLESFMKDLAAAGITIDRPYRLRRPGEQRVALGYAIDAWGTAIEMTENLAPDKPGTH
jgi:catechol 2,3-dioxygenase-like lactoylglutathione lyase family enzyme